MVAIPFIYFLLLSIYLIRKNKGIDICAFLVLVYAFSAGCSILVDLFNIYDKYGVCEQVAISPMSVISYCALITITILPFRLIRSCDLSKIELQKEWVLDVISLILIITFFTTLISTLTNLDAILQTNLKEIRDDVYSNTDDVKLTGARWLLALPETLFSQFSPIAILLYFVNISQGRKSTLFNWLLLTSSLTPVISAILIAGRTQPIYWFLSISALFILCRPMLGKEQRKKALLPFMIIGLVVGLFIGAVTLARFATVGLSHDTGTIDSLIAYSGQSFINYNNFFCHFTAHDIHFDRIFPLTNYFIIHPGWKLGEYRDLIYSYSGMNIGIFYTFLGDLMVDLGHTGMVIYVVIYSIFCTLVCKNANINGNITMSRILVILILYLIPLHGIFYYSYYKVNVGYFVIGSLFISWMLSHSIKTKS